MTSLNAVRELSQIAHELTGVQLSERHVEMIKSRLQRRLADLKLGSLEEYVAYFHGNRVSEAPKLIGLLTTHHTYFFREFGQFEYLADKALPDLRAEVLSRPDKTLRVWSAACSRGQEVYSLAMFLDHYLPRAIPGAKYEILGTDVDPGSVAIAKNGVYPRDELKEVPLSLIGTHWAQGKGEIAAFVKAKASLSSRCRFAVGNLLSIDPSVTHSGLFDLVFCRNVFIYFNAEQIREITRQLIARMNPKGCLFVGISESLSQLGLPLRSRGPSVYCHAQAVEVATAPKVQAPKLVKVSQPSVIRVLCVDDSPSILALLKRVLDKEHGFEVVGTAENGIQASAKLKELKPDIVTMDIHMPEQDGVSYLEKNFNKEHPPVVIISSVSREQTDLAGRVLDLGASDYIEKPALQDLKERSDEIRNKVRWSFQMGQEPALPRSSNTEIFGKVDATADPNIGLRVCLLSLSSRQALRAFINELRGKQSPCLLLIEGSSGALSSAAKTLSKELRRPVSSPDEVPSQLKVDEIVLLDVRRHLQQVIRLHKSRELISVLVFGELSQGAADQVAGFEGAQLLLEDLGDRRGTRSLDGIATDTVPVTSFAYMSSSYLAGGLKKAKVA